MFFKVPKCLSATSIIAVLMLSFSSHASIVEEHDQVSRYQGSTLKNSGVIHYKSILVPVNVVPQTEGTELVEVIGKITAHGYLLDAKKSALEVGLNYKQVAERLGAEVLVDCVDMLCGYQPLDFYWDSWAHINSLAAEDDEDNTRFLVAKKTTEKGDTYYQWIITVDYYGVVGIDQTIIEPEALLLDQVKVNSSVAVAVSQSRVVAERDDIEGSQDHPIISRYQGAYITSYQQREHEQVVIPTGVAIDKVTPVIELEGKGTTIGYQLDNSQSTLQIYKNYLAALTNADFDVLFSCSLETCGSDLLYDLYSSDANQHRFSPINRTNYSDSDFRFISAKLATPASAVYLFVAIDGAVTSNDTNRIVVDIVEVSEMNEGKVSIDAQYLNNEIAQKGRVVLHGLNFDFNKSTLLPSSTESLTAMVQYLSAHPNQSFYVVGHTDNVGSYDVNTQLSEARAQSVIKALAELKVDKSRLYAVGVGPVSPKIANNSKANQAENRRVELVLR
ncbi:OmpA family protein [uncultured Shewanella sp.]|uniref:OmpA family protein n=1 Tax=uncultured Shewanella sp. TaxID=173975 RepID=UPI00260FB12E|nr:OmpA family protein [uncultured Shewanella sp.]